MNDRWLKIGTFNVRGLKNSNKSKDLVNDVTLYDLDICCIQETRETTHICKQIKNNKGEGYFYINLESSNHFHGIGFIIKKV